MACVQCCINTGSLQPRDSKVGMGSVRGGYIQHIVVIVFIICDPEENIT